MKLNKWEKIAGICIAGLSFVLISVYFLNFSLGLSSDSSDWGNFGSYIGGAITPLLTLFNIWLFYKLTIVVEDKNSERDIRNKIYESQGVITQMRMRLYEDVRPLINEVKSDIYVNRFTQSRLTELKKRLMEIDSSLLFRSNISSPSFLKNNTEEVLKTIQTIESPRYRSGDEENLIRTLDSYLYQMEFYIITQSIKDADVYKYIMSNSKNIDSTLNCVCDIANKAIEELNRIERGNNN